ncbi:MAG: TolC family protein [Casimicrobiaceae bacterium]
MTLGIESHSRRRDRGRRPEFRPLRVFSYPAIFLIVAGCSHALPSIGGAPSSPPVREGPWRVPAGVVPAEPIPDPTVAAALDTARAAGPMELGQVVDMALRSNPRTQLTWAQARAGAAQYGAAHAALIPTVDGTANVINTQTTSQTGTSLRSTITPTASLSYLLFDFGGRSGNIAAARAAAVALDLTHNATLQDVALQAEASYFNFQATRALRQAAVLALAEADTNLVSAQQRNRAGVATISDVLQAEVLRAQAQLDLEAAEGNLQTARGTLAVAMGLPANARFDLAPVSDSMPVGITSAGVDTLIDRALALRPDLAAVRVQIQQAQAEVRVARSAERPQVILGANLGKTFSNVTNFVGLNYGISLGVQIPIFNLARNYNVTAAEAQVEAANARASLLRVQVGQQVYSAYYALQTATQRAQTSDVLLTSATRNEVVARARYRAGVGTIVDLITAQTALANARAQQAQSRWVWSTALAQLSHDVGVLGPRGQTLPLGDAAGVRR